MIINITANGYISISEFVDESNHFFKKIYIDYTLDEAKKLFKKELKEFKKMKTKKAVI